MILLYAVPELRLIGVEDKGVPNQERVVLQAAENLNLGRYSLLVARKFMSVLATQQPTLINDLLFWFGEQQAVAGQRVIVFTGPRRPDPTLRSYGASDLILNWGHASTLFGLPDDIPVLIRLGSGVVGVQGPDEAPTRKIDPLSLSELLKPQGS